MQAKPSLRTPHVAAFMLRPRRIDEHGTRSGADVFAFFVVIVVPLASLATIFGYWVSYGC
jgi:hypothetical protein